MSKNKELDTLIAWAARGLGVAKRGLEASARWLDARAKVVGELAAKLGSSAPVAPDDGAAGAATPAQ